MDEMQNQSSCGFLSLSLELRHQIYDYVLPYAPPCWEDYIPEWNRGHVSILGTNKQIYLEAVALLYGTNTFLLIVRDDCIHWVYRTFTSPDDIDGTVHHVPINHACPKAMTPKNISRIRRLSVQIWPPEIGDGRKRLTDSQNTSYANPHEGFLRVMEGQISVLLTVLRQMKEIQDLDIGLWLLPRERHKGYARTLLSPLMSLINVRNIDLYGTMSPEFDQEITDHFRNSAAKSKTEMAI